MTKTRIHKLTAWLLTLAMLMTFIPSFTVSASAEESTVSVKIEAVSVTNGNALAGAHLQLLDEHGDVVVIEGEKVEWESSDGAYEITGLNTDKDYIIRAAEAPDGYIYPNNTEFRIDATHGLVTTGSVTIDGVILIEFTPTKVEISAVDIADGNALAGATIRVINQNGNVENVVSEWISDGTAHEVTGLVTGKEYVLRAAVAPAGYALPSDTKFVIDKQGMITSTGTVDKTGILLVEFGAMPTYTVTVTNDGNGTGEANPASGEEGTEVTLTAIPSAGYQFKEWQVLSGGVTITDNKFTIGTANVEIKAVFEEEPTHEHSWRYELDGTDTIKATCSNADGNCDNTDGGNVTIAAPANLDYTGSNIEAVVTNNLVDKTVDVDVVYTAASGSELTEGKPVKVGTYTAKITVGGVTASVEFSIAPAPVVTSIDFNSDSLAYNAVEKTFYVSDDFPFILKIIGENLTSFEDKGGLEALFKQEKSGGWAIINVTIESDTVAYASVDTFTLTYILNDGLGSSKTTAVMVENNDTQIGETKYVSLKHAPTYKLTLNVDENGQAYHNKTSSFVAKDANVTITVVPDIGYELDKLIVDGNDVIASVTNNKYTFIMPEKAVEVSVGFKAAEYTVTFKDWDGSEIDSQTVSHGSAATAPANPTRDGWKFTAWDKAFDNVTGDLTVTAQYAKKTSSTGGGATRYTIKFDTDGGAEIANRIVAKNSKLTEPEAPEKDGFIFAGWYTDKEFTTAYDFDAKVTKSFTLYAKWNEATNEEGDKPGTSGHNCPSLEFRDLDITKWYHFDTDYVIENDIFRGTTKDTFTPDGNITRAMMITVLYRAEGEPATNRSIPFADVDMGSYYANAVIWGKQNGIIKGYSETEFAPEQDILREQIAAIMHRYAQYKGIDVSVGENTKILSYKDFADISEYAIPSMQWAVGSGMIKGRTENTLAPKAFATRVEIAAMLHRFIEANN